MPQPYTILFWSCLLQELSRLQNKWEHKIAALSRRDHKEWVWRHGVLLGIELGRNTVAEHGAKSIAGLKKLMWEWDKIRESRPTTTAAEFMEAMDFGVGLVSKEVRRFLQRSAHRKRSRANNMTNAGSSGQKQRRGSA